MSKNVPPEPVHTCRHSPRLGRKNLWLVPVAPPEPSQCSSIAQPPSRFVIVFVPASVPSDSRTSQWPSQKSKSRAASMDSHGYTRARTLRYTRWKRLPARTRRTRARLHELERAQAVVVGRVERRERVVVAMPAARDCARARSRPSPPARSPCAPARAWRARRRTASARAAPARCAAGSGGRRGARPESRGTERWRPASGPARRRGRPGRRSAFPSAASCARVWAETASSTPASSATGTRSRLDAINRLRGASMVPSAWPSVQACIDGPRFACSNPAGTAGHRGAIDMAAHTAREPHVLRSHREVKNDQPRSRRIRCVRRRLRRDQARTVVASTVAAAGTALNCACFAKDARPSGGCFPKHGEVAERLNAAWSLKTVRPKGLGGSNPSRAATLDRSIPGTWFTDHSGDMVDTFSGANGLGAGSTRPSSRSKKPRS